MCPDLACALRCIGPPRNEDGKEARPPPRHRVGRCSPAPRVLLRAPCQELLTPRPGSPAPRRGLGPPGLGHHHRVVDISGRALLIKVHALWAPSLVIREALPTLAKLGQTTPGFRSVQGGAPHSPAPWVAVAVRSWLCDMQGAGLGAAIRLGGGACCHSRVSPRAIHPPEVTDGPTGVTRECLGQQRLP